MVIVPFRASDLNKVKEVSGDGIVQVPSYFTEILLPFFSFIIREVYSIYEYYENHFTRVIYLLDVLNIAR